MVQNEKVISAFIEHKMAHSPRRDYVCGVYVRHGSSISTDGETLYSYETPIAKWDGARVLVNSTKYSSTTSRQQSELKKMLSASGIETAEM